MKYSFLIIGVGNIGFRHFQSINLIRNSKIFLVDPNIKKILSKKLKPELNSSNKYFFFENIKDIKNVKFNVVIISTSSKERFSNFKYIVTEKISKNIILEKVLFSNLNLYYKYLELNRNYKFNCWVNCLNRIYPISREIKKENKKSKPLQIIVKGFDWGIACNFIHFLDLASFLCRTNKIKKVSSVLEEVFKSKRNGFLEFFGIIKVELSNGTKVIFISNKGNLSYNIKIIYNTKIYNINEIQNTCKIYYKNTVKSHKLEIPKVSELTARIVRLILKKKAPGLVTLKNSLDLHYPVIESICNSLSIKNNKKIVDCKIT